jgi:hypothetical protein
LASETVKNRFASAAAINTGAELSGVVAAGAVVLGTVSILSERDRRE